MKLSCYTVLHVMYRSSFHGCKLRGACHGVFIADDVMCTLIPKKGYLKQHLYSKMKNFSLMESETECQQDFPISNLVSENSLFYLWPYMYAFVCLTKKWHAYNS